MPLIGYARVSTEDQTSLPQSQALKSAGCAEIFEEQASGRNRGRPVLARVLEWIGNGDPLVVMRIDRLARSLSHLLEVIERPEAKGTFFRSLLDPIDTASLQGKFTLQVLGAAAEFERALIRERTKAGLAGARTKGRIDGNPRLRAIDPAALRKDRLARQDAYLKRLNETAQDWVPHVRRHRLGRRAADHQRLPTRGAALDAKPSVAHRERLRPRRLPSRNSARACRTPRNGRSPSCHCRRHQGGGCQHHAADHLRPAGGDARAHASGANEQATLIRQDAVGTRRKAGATRLNSYRIGFGSTTVFCSMIIGHILWHAYRPTTTC